MRRPSRKTAIMRAAARLFADRGYDAVTVRDIAATLELTPASLYYYFPDKETLYRETLVSEFTGVQGVFQKSRGGTGIDRVESLVRDLVDYCCDTPIFTRLLLRELNEGQEERLRFLGDSIFAAIHANFGHALVQCGLQDTDRITESIVSSLLGYLQISRLSHCLSHYAGQPLDAMLITERICAQIRRELRP